MTRSATARVLAGLLLVMLLGVAAAPAALATEEPATTTETSVADGPSGPQPAVVVDQSSGAIEDEAWTFRYLVPTVLVLTVIVVGLTLFAYAVRIRGRYRVVR